MGLGPRRLRPDTRLAGQQRETTNKVYHYGARLYNADIGRFLSADTVVPEPGNPQSLNRYSYVLNNPLRYTDPTGNCPMGDGGGCDWSMTDGGVATCYSCGAYFDQGAASSALEWVGQSSVFHGPGVDRDAGPCHGSQAGAPAAGICNAIEDLWMRETYRAAMALRNGFDLNSLAWSPEQREFLRQMPWLFGYIDQTSSALATDYTAAAVGLAIGAVSLSAIENHHFLPKEFKAWFEAEPRGLNIQEFRGPLTFSEHRAAGRGIHSAPGNRYNDAWEAFIQNNPNATRRQTLQFLRDEVERRGLTPPAGWADRLPRR